MTDIYLGTLNQSQTSDQEKTFNKLKKLVLDDQAETDYNPGKKNIKHMVKVKSSERPPLYNVGGNHGMLLDMQHSQ